MNFLKFKNAVAKQFKKMSDAKLYQTDVDKDMLWETYLSSFPEGTNLMFRERTEHDCNCCKQFIRSVGNLISIDDDLNISSIWDIDVNDVDEGYRVVANNLSQYVKNCVIKNVFVTDQKYAGTDKNIEEIEGNIVTFQHFFVNIPNSFYIKTDNINTILSQKRTDFEMFLRAVKEIDLNSIETVMELIQQNSIYRGQDYKFMLSEFLKHKKLSQDVDCIKYIWKNIDVEDSVKRIRNTAIGTLLVDLSRGRNLEESVKAFEKIVAPTNYKRPTALVSKAMVDNAKAKIEELGLTSSLMRRYATVSDITINNIIFADKNTKKVLENDIDHVFDSISKPKPKNFSKVEEIGIEDFIKNVLPNSNSVEIFVDAKHEKNLMSLVTACDCTSPNLFKWNNHFSWSYKGEVADSIIIERVKKAGGSIEGNLCCRLAWYNHDDLDLHMVEPNGYEIHFRNKRTLSPSGGMLDVDMNAGHGQTREPVENIFYSNKQKMKTGVYRLFVNQYCARDRSDTGFDIEISIDGLVYNFSYTKTMKTGEIVDVIEIEYTKNNSFKILKSLEGTAVKKKFWNIESGNFQKVNIIMNSPNYWDDQIGIGNKHYFFMIENCKNEDTVRGFYNEFLRTELEQHRKVLEILGSKIGVEYSEKQLSGLGFSSTQRNEVLLRVSGKTKRVVKVKF